MIAEALAADGDATRVMIRLTPHGGRDALEGLVQLADGRVVIRARVRAVPENGAANAALIKLVAAYCNLPISAVGLDAGATTRLKTIRIARPYLELKPVFSKLSM
ncbi:COG1872 Uncharacterized conserved protein [Rhabdaerophilaceae bacterium]